MSQQVKRAPGRPKKVQSESVATKPEKGLKWKEPEKRNAYEYAMINRGGVVCLLKQQDITVYDKEKDEIRAIRYCENEPSIYRDEQSTFAVVSPVVFRDKRLIVRQDQPNLRAFLDAHPSNVANGGTRFKLVDKKADAEIELKKEFEVLDAVSIVRDSDINDLIPVAMYFNINTSKKSSEIRHDLLRIAKGSTESFMQAFDSPQVKTRAIISQAASYNYIVVKSDGTYWADSNKLIVSTPAGMDSIDVMTRFCLTEKGSLVLDKLSDQLDKL